MPQELSFEEAEQIIKKITSLKEQRALIQNKQRKFLKRLNELYDEEYELGRQIAILGYKLETPGAEL
jgi:hypothetical protein